MILLLLILGFALGADPRRLLILGVILAFPPLVMVPAGLAYWEKARSTDSRPILFCQGVAAELRAGASLPSAVAAAAQSVGCDDLETLALSGDIGPAASSAAREFPAIAPELELTITRAAGTGGSAADLFDEIGSLALAQEEIRREVRVAAAPAKAATVVFIVLPAGYLLSRWAGGDLQSLFSIQAQRYMAVAGLALFAVGLAVALFLVSRAR